VQLTNCSLLVHSGWLRYFNTTPGEGVVNGGLGRSLGSIDFPESVLAIYYLQRICYPYLDYE
jgi:hypothetical protein